MINNETFNPEKANGIELSDDVDNQYLKLLFDNKIIKFFSKNTSSKIAIATALVTIGSFFIKVLSYMWLKGYLSVFSISIDSVGYSSNHGFIEFLINAVTFIGLAIAVSMAYVVIEFLVQLHQLRKITYSITKATFFQKFKGLLLDIKNSILIFLVALFITELINILLGICIISGKPFFAYTIIEWLAVLLMLTIIEIITAVTILFIHSIKNRKQIKEKKKAALLTDTELEETKKKVPMQKNIFIDFITSSVVLLFFLYSTSTYLSGALSAQQKKSFPIIEGRYAVVYQDQQHYWVIASQEKSVDSLLLNTTSQKILDINDIGLTIKSYKEVVILYK